MDAHFIVNGKQMAEILDLSTRRIQQLAKSEVFPPMEKPNRYKLVECIQGYVRYLRGQALHADAPQDLKEAKLRQEKAKAEILEMEALQKNGELQHQDDVMKVWTSITSLIKAKLLALSSRVSSEVYGATSLVQVRTKIDNEISLILNELTNEKVEIDASSNRVIATHNTNSIKPTKATAKTNR